MYLERIFNMSERYETLLRQSSYAADDLLESAIKAIDKLGLDRDPRTIAAYMQAAIADFKIMTDAMHREDAIDL
jgi:hypothetical protein|tara:strand:+ start:970 stop:1191 length:222 start_codon:yes stop_codon:yes gene_type:complete